MSDIKLLLPSQIEIKVWDEIYKTDLVSCETVLKYVLEEQIIKDIKTDNVLVYIWWELFDTIEKSIELKAWDTLHLEYTIYGEEE